MWSLMVVDTDNFRKTPVLYKTETEEKAKQVLKNTFIHLVETEDVFEMIESFEWLEFGERNLRLIITYNNGAVEDYIAIEVKDSYSKYNDFVAFWFSDTLDPSVDNVTFKSKIKAYTVLRSGDYARRNQAEIETELVYDETFLEEEDVDDRYHVLEFSNGGMMVIRRMDMIELGDKQFFDCMEYYDE